MGGGFCPLAGFRRVKSLKSKVKGQVVDLVNRSAMTNQKANKSGEKRHPVQATMMDLHDDAMNVTTALLSSCCQVNLQQQAAGLSQTLL